jgi:hypothetical protein
MARMGNGFRHCELWRTSCLLWEICEDAPFSAVHHPDLSSSGQSPNFAKQAPHVHSVTSDSIYPLSSWRPVQAYNNPNVHSKQASA